MSANAGNHRWRQAGILILVFAHGWVAHGHEYSGGSGTADDPYQIATAADLMTLGETPDHYDKHFILTADIDLDPNLPGRKVFDRAVIAADNDPCAAHSWPEPIFTGPSFTGVLDGKGYAISHLMIVGEGYLGLFGKLGPAASISNVALKGVKVTGASTPVGGLAGQNSGRITISYSTGTVAGTRSVGGLIGYNDNDGSIAASYSTAAVVGDTAVGGLLGANLGQVSVSYSAGGLVVGRQLVGGLVGVHGRTIVGSYSANAVAGDHEVGGLVGWVNGGSTATSFWDMEISGQSSSAGGIGLTTAEMQDIRTFPTAGWDFANEAHNGTCDYWEMSPGEYPRLHYGGGVMPVMSEGFGTLEQPYLIRNARDLGVIWADPTAHYRLEASVNLLGITWPMAVVPWFSGTFQGRSNVIRNLRIQGHKYVGLFGELEAGATISNLGLDVVDVNGIGKYIGYIGGLAGSNKGTIIDCHSAGTITGTGMYVYVGGLVGENHGSIAASSSTSVVMGGSCTGGLVGVSGGSIAMSHTDGSVTGHQFVGGLAGKCRGIITASRSTATITGRSAVGGLVGSNGGSGINTSYASGAVTGGRHIGGLVGYNSSPITASYSTGSVSGNEYVGGLVGSGGDDITSSFWDIQTAGTTASAGGTGPSTPEMQTVATFLEAGWDFVDEAHNGTCDYWEMSPGEYPRLYYGGGVMPVMPEGFGTLEQPYLIHDARDLGTIWAEPTAHYRLEASVDLSGTTWLMAVIPWFSGTFQGQSNVIRDLRIQGHGYLGLFGQLEAGATISDLGLDVVDVNGTGRCIGALAGANKGTITDCRSAGEVVGSGRYVYVGGLVGDNRGSIATSSSVGAVMGGSYTGGLVGVSDGSIAMSHTDGRVTGNQFVGGLAGICRGIITASYSTATIAGRGEVGGLVGSNRGNGINTSYASGAVTGDRNIGGLVGYNSSPITAGYSTGAVTGYEGVGGLVGQNEHAASITHCYSAGTVAGIGGVGGLVGIDWGGSITGSFWDTETSGLSESDGGSGLPTVQMQAKDTYLSAGWDFVDETENGTDDIWRILEGQDYPRLWWEAEN